MSGAQAPLSGELFYLPPIITERYPMLFLILVVGLIGSFISGLGWGGNGSRKDLLSLFGPIVMLAGAILTFTEFGWVFLIIYLALVPGLAKGFEGYFSSKYRGGY